MMPHTRNGMLHLCLVLGAILAAAGWAPAEPAPPFPGAEGFGAGAKGGAGGKVIWVTNLDSEGPGSLRAAIDTKGPRIIAFKVAGTIDVGRETLTIGSPLKPLWRKLRAERKRWAKLQKNDGPWPESPYSFVTIDGSSAPPPGITITGGIHVGYGNSHVIIRHLRIRDNGKVSRSSADCITVGEASRHVIVDHCSLTWSRDECINSWGVSGDHTYQWCLVQGYGPHGTAFINGGGTDRITLHHNLAAHSGRSWRVSGNARGHWKGKYPNDNPLIDIRNTVVYNWNPWIGSYVASGAHINFVGNTYIPGPSTSLKYPAIYMQPSCAGYVAGNDTGPLPKRRPGSKGGRRMEQPFPALPVTTHSARDAKTLVLSQVGAWPRDAIDAGIVRTVLQGTGYLSVKNTIPADFTNARPTAVASAQGTDEITFKGAARDRDGKIVSYTWDFGDGQVGIGQTAKHTYKKPGDYVATLFAMDGMGMTGYAQLKLRVAPGKPVAAQAIPSKPIPPFPPTPPEGTKPPLVLRVPRTPQPIADGKFPPAEAWAEAPQTAPFIRQSSWGKRRRVELEARLLHDSKHLFLKVVAPNPKHKKYRVRPMKRAVTPRQRLWTVFNTEIYLAPAWGREPWHQFVFNTNGNAIDSKGYERKWDCTPDWHARSRVENDKWVLEVGIPLAAVGIKPAGKETTCALKLSCGTAKDQIFIWPPLILEKLKKHRWRQPVTQSADPTGYAQLVLE